MCRVADCDSINRQKKAKVTRNNVKRENWEKMSFQLWSRGLWHRGFVTKVFLENNRAESILKGL